jgi:hypothetical protein
MYTRTQRVRRWARPFAGSWHSPVACANPSAPWRWEVTVNAGGSGRVSFHNCPGGGRVAYTLGGGTVTGPNQMTFTGLIDPTSAVGPLGGGAAALVEFVITENGAPSPNLAP